jgi:hypothetical protein
MIKDQEQFDEDELRIIEESKKLLGRPWEEVEVEIRERQELGRQPLPEEEETAEQEIDRLWAMSREIGGPPYGYIREQVENSRRSLWKERYEKAQKFWRSASVENINGLDIEEVRQMRTQSYRLIEAFISQPKDSSETKYSPSDREISNQIAKLKTYSFRIAQANPAEIHSLLHADYSLGYEVLAAEDRLEGGLAKHFSRGIHAQEKQMAKQKQKGTRQQPPTSKPPTA